MKTLKLGICMMDEDDQIISAKAIGTDWAVDLSQEPREEHDVFMKKNLEITTLLTDTFKYLLKREDISEVLDDVRAKNV